MRGGLAQGCGRRWLHVVCVVNRGLLCPRRTSLATRRVLPTVHFQDRDGKGMSGEMIVVQGVGRVGARLTAALWAAFAASPLPWLTESTLRDLGDSLHARENGITECTASLWGGGGR